jgi:hypothetical protein
MKLNIIAGVRKSTAPERGSVRRVPVGVQQPVRRGDFP